MTDGKIALKTRESDELPSGTHVVQIRVDDIRPNRAQPRADFDNNAIIRLADSIRRYGILQPLTVRRSDLEDIYSYELIAGERRLRASRLLGLLTVPCIIMEADEKLSAELAIIENLLRENLNMFEQAYGFKKLIENHQLTQEEVAKRMSMSQSAVANKMRLLKLSYKEQLLILELGLSERHARALLKLPREETRISAIRHIAADGLTVLAAEEYIERLLERECNHADTARSRNAAELGRNNIVESIRRKVDSLNRISPCATLEVSDRKQYLDLHIRIKKEGC